MNPARGRWTWLHADRAGALLRRERRLPCEHNGPAGTVSGPLTFPRSAVRRGASPLGQARLFRPRARLPPQTGAACSGPARSRPLGQARPVPALRADVPRTGTACSGPARSRPLGQARPVPALRADVPRTGAACSGPARGCPPGQARPVPALRADVPRTGAKAPLGGRRCKRTNKRKKISEAHLAMSLAYIRVMI